MPNLISQYNKCQLDFINDRNDKFWDYLLNKRKLTKEVINRFELGYNNKWFNRGNNEPLIGYNAITIPFRDICNKGRIIAYQSRFVDKTVSKDGTEYRYFNTVNIPGVYERSKLFYNLYNVLLSPNYNGEVYITEGSFDLMALACAGIDNVLAAGRNDMSLEQIEILRKYFHKIIFILDNGVEGQMLVRRFKSDRIYDLELYGYQVGDIDDIHYKDVNDILVADKINIKEYKKIKIKP
jgi:DNA primase